MRIARQDIAAGDLAVVWCSWSWSKDPSVQPWAGSICSVCAQTVRIVDGKLAPHLRPVDSDPSDNILCAGGGQAPGQTIYVQQEDYWRLVVKSSGRELGTFETQSDAEIRMREIAAATGPAPTTVEGVKKDDSVSRVNRFDLAELAAPTRTADGFLKVDGRVARTGVQEYRDGMGRTRRELRLPEEVGRSVAGFTLAPLTNQHPPEPVTPKNAKKYVVGAVGEATMNADGWVSAPLTIYDAAAILDAEQGRRQLSVGYSCRLEVIDSADPSLVQRYGTYDAIQRDIIVNHTALVDIARAGSDARIRLDAADAISIVCDTETPVAWSIREPNSMPIKMKLDGLEVEVADANAQAIIERSIATARKVGEDKATVETTRADGLQKSLSELQAKHDGLTSQVKADAGKADAGKVVKIDGVDVPLAELADKIDGLITAAADKRANSRASLLTEARRHLGANEKLDGKTEIEIKKLVIGKLDKEAKLDGRDDAYVATRYEVEIEKANRVRPIDNVRTLTAPVVVPVVTDSAPAEPVAARQGMVARNHAANVKNQKRGV